MTHCVLGSVSGTPTYFLNDVPIAAESTWTLSDWKQVIDPLLVGAQSLTEVGFRVDLVTSRLETSY